MIIWLWNLLRSWESFSESNRSDLCRHWYMFASLPRKLGLSIFTLMSDLLSSRGNPNYIMNSRIRNPYREPRRYANHRSRSCDSSRSRHYVAQRTPSISVISKYNKRQRSRDVSVEYSDRYAAKKTTKRPHRRQEESVRYQKFSRLELEISKLINWNV